MLVFSISIPFSLFVTSHALSARSEILFSNLIPQGTPLVGDCEAKCNDFLVLRTSCNEPHCGCRLPFIRGQVDCLLCQADTPKDKADVQFLLEAELSQCHSEGIPVEFQINLPSTAVDIVQKVNQENARLRSYQSIFLSLQILGGHVGLVTILIIAVLSRDVHRGPTFLNFCISGILSSIVFSLMLYRGRQDHTVFNPLGQVSPKLCLAQVSLSHGVQIMTVCSTLALVIQLWLDINRAVHQDLTHRIKRPRWVMIILLVTPYIFLIVFALPSFAIGELPVIHTAVDLQSAVVPTAFYCSNSVGHMLLVHIMYGITLGLLISAVVLDAFVIKLLYKHWWDFRHLQTNSALALSTFSRLILFSIIRIVVAIADGVFMLRATKSINDSEAFTFPIWADMFRAAIPLMTSIIFGTNIAMINTVLFWRKKGQ